MTNQYLTTEPFYSQRHSALYDKLATFKWHVTAAVVPTPLFGAPCKCGRTSLLLKCTDHSDICADSGVVCAIRCTQQDREVPGSSKDSGVVSILRSIYAHKIRICKPRFHCMELRAQF